MQIVWIFLITITNLAFGNYQHEYLKSQNRDSWTKMSPFCNSENYMQSPINIDTKLTIKPSESSTICAPKKQLDWNFKGDERDILVENTGHSLKITAIHPNDALSNVDNAIKLNREKDGIAELSNYFNINNGNEANHDYCLDSINIHWGRNGKVGSEHTINGQHYPLELHFVHFSCDFDNLQSALSSWVEYGDEGRDIYVVGTVAVLFNMGEENELIARILDKHHRLQEKGQSAIINNVNLNCLIPDNLGYYTYDGTFTLPPCQPCVKWHILSTAQTVSPRQIEMLRTLLSPITGPDSNAKLATNPNPVYECQ